MRRQRLTNGGRHCLRAKCPPSWPCTSTVSPNVLRAAGKILWWNCSIFKRRKLQIMTLYVRNHDFVNHNVVHLQPMVLYPLVSNTNLCPMNIPVWSATFVTRINLPLSPPVWRATRLAQWLPPRQISLDLFGYAVVVPISRIEELRNNFVFFPLKFPIGHILSTTGAWAQGLCHVPSQLGCCNLLLCPENAFRFCGVCQMVKEFDGSTKRVKGSQHNPPK